MITCLFNVKFAHNLEPHQVFVFLPQSHVGILTLPYTPLFFILLASTLANNLLRFLTKLIGLKSFMLLMSSFLAINTQKVEFMDLVNFPVA